MTLDSLVGVGLLTWAISLLAAAALRLVSTFAPRGLERALAAIVCVTAALVTASLILGRIDLGTDRVALRLRAARLVALARGPSHPGSARP